MTNTSPLAVPRSILLATDTGHRSDRATDRALTCARQWQARLLALTVLEDGSVPTGFNRGSAAAIMREDLRAAAEGVDVQSQIREGVAVDVILDSAVQEGSDLIVTGIAKGGLLGDFILGSTAGRLVRRSPVPVLVVHQRGIRRYRRLIVATDFSETSRQALLTALAWFPGLSVLLFNAYRLPLSGLVDSDRVRADLQADAVAQAERFLDDTPLSADDRKRVLIHAAYGSADALLNELTMSNHDDLVVLGSHGRTAMFDVLIGSTAKRLLEHAATDVLVVRDPRAAGATRETGA